MYQKLFDIISRDLSISQKDMEYCKTCFEQVSFPKNYIVEEEGKIPEHLYFIVSGFMRLFHYHENGNEVTTHINCPPGFIASYSGFINQTKTNDSLECITECDLLRITKPNLDLLTLNSPVFKDFSISVFQQSLAYNEKRSMELATLSADQRYKKLLEDHPDIVRHVPVQYIASFLGMKPESLSRIRRQMNN
jgi:CRP-like cAMP-binding protein